jgi:CMP-N,N'-diacetyllegionaminic acid synthase
MKILVLIPARGGSKRIPGKNIKLLGDKPLITWTIEAAKGIPEICDILVSTDSPEIASIAEGAGASVPWMRPIELATDTATSVDVAIHALDWYESTYGAVDGILLLQPTSPFRRKKTIVRAIELFSATAMQNVVGVSNVKQHPSLMLSPQGDVCVPFIERNTFETRSQEMSTLYIVNGCIYLITGKRLRDERSFVGSTCIPLLISEEKESLDIDDIDDFNCASNFLVNERPT